jgi:hypothetical protein
LSGLPVMMDPGQHFRQRYSMSVMGRNGSRRRLPESGRCGSCRDEKNL